MVEIYRGWCSKQIMWLFSLTEPTHTLYFCTSDYIIRKGMCETIYFYGGDG